MSALTSLQPVARGEVQHDQAQIAEDARSASGTYDGSPLPLQERLGRAGRVDHHRAEREQAQRGRVEDRVLDRSLAARHAQASGLPSTPTARIHARRHQPRKCSPRSSKSRYWSKLAQAGREQHHLARPRPPPRRPPRRCSRSPQRQQRRRCRRGRARAAPPPRRSGSRRGSARSPASRSPSKPPPLRLPPRIACTPPSKASMPRRGGGHVGGLRVVHVEHAAGLGHLLEPVRHAGELAQRLAHRVGAARRDASAAAAAPIAFSRLWAPRSRISAASMQRLAAPGERRRRELAGPQPGRAEPHPPGAAGSRASAGRRHRDVARALVGEDAQLRVAVGLEACRGGRGGPRSRLRSTRGLGRERARVLELEARGLADDHGVRVERRRPATTAACRRCPATATGSARRRGGSRRAARPWWSCRSCRSPRRTRSAAAARPSSSSPMHRDAALARGRDHGRLARHAGALDHVTAHARRGAPTPSVSRWTSTPARRAVRARPAVARRSPRRAAAQQRARRPRPSGPARRPGTAPAAAGAAPALTVGSRDRLLVEREADRARRSRPRSRSAR